MEEVSNSIMEGGEEGVERIEFEDSKDLQQQSKAFDKLTDRVEDRQLDSTRVQEVSFYSFLFLLLLLYYFPIIIKVSFYLIDPSLFGGRPWRPLLPLLKLTGTPCV